MLIGGQALGYWCSWYEPQAPELTNLVVTSKDVDFQGTSEDMASAATRLESQAHWSKDLPCLGYVPFDPDGKGEARVDFLTSPLGLPADLVQEEALIAPTAAGSSVRVMHPLHCLISRVENVVQRPERYENEHGLNQLRAAIICAREYLRDKFASERRHALDQIEQLFEYCCEQSCLVLFIRSGIDVLEAMPTGPKVPANFALKRLPQMRATLEQLRR